MTKKKIYKFTMPPYIQLSDRLRKLRKATAKKKVGTLVPPKKYYINLNQFSLWYHSVRNSVKRAYMELAKKQLLGVVMSTPIKITFIQYKGDRGKSDRANACCIHEKFFCDALQEAGCIPDDNDKYILETKYLSGGYEKGNARVEIIIEEV